MVDLTASTSGVQNGARDGEQRLQRRDTDADVAALQRGRRALRRPRGRIGRTIAPGTPVAEGNATRPPENRHAGRVRAEATRRVGLSTPEANSATVASPGAVRGRTHKQEVHS